MAKKDLAHRAEVTTTNATPTTICSVTLPAGTSGLAKADLLSESGDANAFSAVIVGSVRRTAAGGAVIDAQANVFSSAGFGAIGAASATLVASGNNIILQFTGVAATTIKNHGNLVVQTLN